MSRFNKITLLFLVSLISFNSFADSNYDFLTKEENQYLNNLGPLTVAFLDGIAPLQYKNSKGEQMGISISIMDEVSEILGLDIEYQSYKKPEDLSYNYQDIILSSTQNYLTDDIILSDPYLKSELLIYINKKYSLKDLKGKKYAIVSGGAIPDDIDKNNVVFFDSRKDVLDAIEKGKVDYALGNAFSLTYYGLQNNYKNIYSLPSYKDDREYSFGLTKGNELLLGILNKGLKEISESRRQSLILDNLSRVERKINLADLIEQYFLEIFIVLIFIMIFIIGTNKRLKNEIKDIKEKNES